MGSDDLRDQLISYLSDMHSTEENALKQLRTGADGVEDAELAEVLREHLAETEEHERLVRERLEAYGESPSGLKDVAQKGGALLAGAVAKAAPDTTGKIAIQAYATEHLEIASYRMLRTVADQAGDQETVRMAERILGQERAAAEKLDGLLERVAIVSLPQAAA
jgi:ferritin-like metal-binding protein YciE